jgi:C-terminal processing protease CtpA/Prc
MEPVRGIGLMLRPNEEGFEVAEVMPGTPAERVGVLKGDLIFAVDGVPVHERGCQRIYGDDRVDSHVLSLRRGDNSIEISVPVEVLVP